MPHTKVYGFCDAKCKVEVAPKTVVDGKLNKNSNDTMNGELTLKKRLVIGFDSPNIFNVDTGGDTLTDTNRTYFTEYYRDKNNLSIGTFVASKISDTNALTFNAISYDSDNVQYWGSLRIVSDGINKVRYVTVPTPSSPTDSSTKIATTEWVNDINNDVLHKSRNETIPGPKTFTANTTFTSNLSLKGALYNPILITNPSRDRNAGTQSYGTGIYIRDSGGKECTYLYSLGSVDSNTGVVKSNTQLTSLITNPSKNETVYSTIQTTACSDGTTYATCPNPPNEAISNEIATAKWVNNKLAQKNKVTNVTSFDQLIELIKSGKRGDSFGLTVDYTGNSMGGITNTDGVETHAFGHYTIEEINVSDSTLNSFQAFGSGEVSGKFVTDDTKTYVHATTGFGRAKVFEGLFDAFRVVEDGSLSYFIIGSANVTSFEGYYISI